MAEEELVGLRVAEGFVEHYKGEQTCLLALHSFLSHIQLHLKYMNKVINFYYYYGFQIFIEAGHNVLLGHVFCPQCY